MMTASHLSFGLLCFLCKDEEREANSQLSYNDFVAAHGPPGRNNHTSACGPHRSESCEHAFGWRGPAVYEGAVDVEQTHPEWIVAALLGLLLDRC